MKPFKHGPFERVPHLARWTGISAITLMVATVMLSMTTIAQAVMDENQIARKIEKDFNVQVLRVEPITENGKQLFAVTVMSPPGNRNSAFQVNTIAVDAETGNLVIQYRHTGSMLRMPAPPVSERTYPLTADDR